MSLHRRKREDLGKEACLMGMARGAAAFRQLNPPLILDQPKTLATTQLMNPLKQTLRCSY